MTALGGKRGETPRSSEHRERSAFDSKGAKGKRPAWLEKLDEGFNVESTLQQPAFRSRHPQRKSPFSGRLNKNGIPLL